jgi:hypothetical protein
MDFKTSKVFIDAAVAISLKTFAVPVGFHGNASPAQLLLGDRGVQIAQGDATTTEKKTEEKTTQSTDSNGMPQENKHVEHKTTDTSNGNGSNGEAEKTTHKGEVNQSTNTTGDTIKEEHHTTESSQHNY